MALLAVKSWVSEDKTQTIIELMQNDGRPIHISLATSDLDQFMQQLSIHRSGMINRPANGSASAATATVVANPKWEVTARNSGEGKLLTVHHSGFGGLSFLFSDAEAKNLAQALSPSPQEPRPPKLNTGRNRASKKSRSSARK